MTNSVTSGYLIMGKSARYYASRRTRTLVHQASYAWKVFSAEPLRAIERYWNKFVKSNFSFLPERFSKWGKRRRVRQPREGTPLILPTMPKLPGKTADNRSSDKWRCYRTSYDWKAYSSAQLPYMEQYWDEFVRLYERLLPERFAKEPSNFRGINLGTFNGAYQKAWMRRGYKMYGVELMDVADELHEYGCEGQQASFFDLHELKDGEFDFAVMDRAFFLKPTHAFEFDDTANRYIELGAAPDRITAKLKFEISPVEITVPPFFKEIFRVLNDDGAFLGILYPNWSGTAVRELCSYGETKLWPVKRAVPFLAISVDRNKVATPFPEKEAMIADIVASDGRGAPSSVQARLDANPYVGKLDQARRGAARFHYLPTNEIVTLDLGTNEIAESEVPLNLPDAEAFFRQHDDIVLLKGTGGSPRKCTVSLFDRAQIGSPTETGGFYAPILSLSDMIVSPKKKRNSKDVLANWPLLKKYIEEHYDASTVYVIVTNALSDSIVQARSNLPKIKLAQSITMSQKILDDMKKTGHQGIVLLPPEGDSVSASRAQLEALNNYRCAYANLAQQYQVPTLDLTEMVHGKPAYTEISKTLAYRSALGHAISKVISSSQA